MKIVPVILAGGSGTRLWPLSRSAMPKQFVPLTGGESLFSATVARVADRSLFEAPLVVCNDEHRFIAAQQLLEAGQSARALLLEPVGRDTAPAAALAALHLVEEDPEAVLLVLPSDHHIRDVPAFLAAVAVGAQACAQSALVTFGIEPNAPETGFGYIKAGAPLPKVVGALRIERFVEKPPLEQAEAFLASGEYSWNSGMFLFRARDFLAELELHHPTMLQACRAVLPRAQHQGAFISWDGEAFAEIPAGPIDTIVMEKTERAAVVPLSCGWNDLGSWRALWEVAAKDESGNVAQGDVLAIDSEGSLIQAQGRLTVALGVKDLIIVDSEDALLVMPKSRAQETKSIVARLKSERPNITEFHRTVHRPWGSFTHIDEGEGFQVKRIIVQPGCKLSTQLHHRRAEHWVMVKGSAEVLIGEETRMLEENQSVFIPAETKHRLANPGNTPIMLIEVQYGDYLGEDDIVRFADDYGRA